MQTSFLSEKNFDISMTAFQNIKHIQREKSQLRAETTISNNENLCIAQSNRLESLH